MEKGDVLLSKVLLLVEGADREIVLGVAAPRYVPERVKLKFSVEVSGLSV